MTHLDTQTNTLYRNDGDGFFSDVTDRAGLGAGSLVFTGFGTRFFDYDNDTRLDLFVANGAVITETSRIGVSDFPYEQRNQLFRNGADGRFVEIPDPSLETLRVSRGAAFGDADNDGDIDVLVTNANGPAELLVNGHDRNDDWIGLELVDRHGRDGYGARVAVHRGAGQPLWRRVHTDGSYLSANDPRVHVGLGSGSTPVDVDVVWHSGNRQSWRALARGRYHTLVEDDGAGGPDAGPGVAGPSE